MKVVQDVQGQLEFALNALRNISGSDPSRGGQVSVSLYVRSIGGVRAEDQGQVSPQSMDMENSRSRSSSTMASTPILPVSEFDGNNNSASTSRPIFGIQSSSTSYTYPMNESPHPTYTGNRFEGLATASTSSSNPEGKCCGGATTCAPAPAQTSIPTILEPQAPADRNDGIRSPKRGRFESPYRSTPTYSASVDGWRASYQDNVSPEDEIQRSPINGAECCLGVVKCNERGEIIG